MNKIFSPLVLILLLAGCQSHFISDSSYRKEVEKQFEKRKATYGQSRPELFKFTDDQAIGKEQKEALKFLYAYMSLNDIADYDADFFEQQVKAAFQAKNYFTWGKKVPEDLFRHFVLPPRVNNENMDSARIVFFNELKERIKGMTMTEAALEVNHWCHEKVTYRPADGRTSAPLATVRNAFGRCGEESTFTVTALRAVGIPARQCYTPRWAHTDDNHAWVEVWTDGKWHYMGACEPEAELDKAWFTYPAKRAMMVHTNVFGKYNGKESKTEFPLFTKINVLENYTDTKKLEVKVTDEQGIAIPDATVRFQLYNYAEYYNIYTQQTDKNGKAYVISGLGDLVVSASKGEKYGYKKVSLQKENNVVITLSRVAGNEYEEDMDITPPANKAVFAKDTSAKTKENNIRLKYEDSVRNAYLSTFMTKENAYKLATPQLNKEKVAEYIAKSEGNYKEIAAFIKQNANNPYALSLLSTLTDKDLRDTPADILQSHLKNTESKKVDEQVFVQGILSPRISLELIRDWRPYLQQKFKATFPSNVSTADIKNWVIKHIEVTDEENYSGCPISPIGVEKLHKADKRSRDIFFVALCRSFHMPAKIDMATSEIKIYENGLWKTISLDPSLPEKPIGNITISYKSNDDLTPQYLSYYSVSKYKDGDFIQLDYEDDARVSKFPVKLTLEEGYYRLTTGNRYADGKVLTHNSYFTIQKGKDISIPLTIRPLIVNKKVYGNVDKGIEAKWYENDMIICFLEPDKEPTKHIMNDIPLFKKEFDKWSGKFVFVVPEANLREGFSAKQYKNLPSNSMFLPANSKNVAINGTALMNSFLKSANQAFRDNYPLLYMVNKKGEIVFYSEGYRIGMGDMLWKAIKMNE